MGHKKRTIARLPEKLPLVPTVRVDTLTSLGWSGSRLDKLLPNNELFIELKIVIALQLRVSEVTCPVRGLRA